MRSVGREWRLTFRDRKLRLESLARRKVEDVREGAQKLGERFWVCGV